MAMLSFTGRNNQLRRIQSNFQNRESMILWGETHIGKSALLNQIENLRASLLGNQNDKTIISRIDGHQLGGNIQKLSDFWAEVLTPLENYLSSQLNTPDLTKIKDQFKRTIELEYSIFELDRLFKILADRNNLFLLLFDEFESVLDHPVLRVVEFLGGLRKMSCSADKRGLLLVIASTKTKEQLNIELKVMLSGQVAFSNSGSPFFNAYDQIAVGPLEKRAM